MMRFAPVASDDEAGPLYIPVEAYPPAHPAATP